MLQNLQFYPEREGGGREEGIQGESANQEGSSPHQIESATLTLNIQL